MVRAAVFIVILPINLLFWGTLVFSAGLVKLVTFGAARRGAIRAAAFFGESWVAINDWLFDALLDTRWEIRGVEGLRRDLHYLAISNHVSWIDILAAFRTFNRRGPFLRFFLKSNLIFAPIVGQAAWALDFPFMRRYSPEYLEKHPEKRGRDLEATRIACQRYREVPVTILNYVEGTRFTPQKQAEQQSPYRHLLRPRVGGMGFVIASMAGQLDAIYDLTIVYPKADVSIWDLVTNKLPWIVVDVRRIAIPPELTTSAITEPGPARDQFRAWVAARWQEKDELIERILVSSAK
ncbi:MAG TPA: acetyltransferase [Thermoanaerobaculia bacterium]